MLRGKVVIITGGTKGIGFAVAEKFLKNGAKVAILGTGRESVEKALANLKGENNSYEVIGFWPKLNNPEEVADTFFKVTEVYGRLDILINNAGMSGKDSIYDYKPETFQEVIDLNLNAVFICSQAAARIMKPQGKGVILNTSSMVSLYGQPAGAAYPASKFGVNGLTKSLARELGKDHILVNAVAPGITRTDMVASLPEEMIKPLIQSIPLGRMAEPEDIANAFLFLASDMADYITGIVLSVDGAAMS